MFLDGRSVGWCYLLWDVSPAPGIRASSPLKKVGSTKQDTGILGSGRVPSCDRRCLSQMQTEPGPHPDRGPGSLRAMPWGLCLGIFRASRVQLRVQLGGWSLLVALLGLGSRTLCAVLAPSDIGAPHGPQANASSSEGLGWDVHSAPSLYFARALEDGRCSNAGGDGSV